MISFFRFVRYLDDILLVFNGDQQDVADLQSKLAKYPSVRINKSDRITEVEQGYYCYFHGGGCENTAMDVYKFLKERYKAPAIEVLAFIGDRPVEGKNAVIEISDAIESYFRKEGYRVFADKGGVSIFPPEGTEFAPGFCGYIGVCYRISRHKNNHPALILDVAHRFEFHGSEAPSDIILQRQLGQRAGNAFSRRNQFSTHSTEEIFARCRGFIERLPTLDQLGGLRFPAIPASAQEMGFDVWLWPVDYAAKLQAANNTFITYPTANIIDKLGMLSYPTNEPVVFLVAPSNEIHKHYGNHFNSSYYLNILQQRLLSFLPDNNAEVRLANYSVDDRGEAVLQLVDEAINETRKMTAIHILVCPPKENNKSSEPFDIEIDRLTNKLAHDLRFTGERSFVESITWDKLEDQYDGKYAVESSLVRALVSLGAVPWLIDNMPCNEGEALKDLCFIGMDINRFKNDQSIAGGVIFDARGRLIAHQIVSTDPANGDCITASDCLKIVKRLLRWYNEATLTQPRHIIVHLDGTEHKNQPIDNQWISDLLVDYVEIRKSGGLRLRMPGNRQDTLSRDIAIGSEVGKIAFLNNTKPVLTGNIFPSPNTLTIKRISGTTPLKILAAQVYALSNANYDSLRRTEQIPLTIKLADALVNNAKLKKGKSEMGGPVAEKILYWL